MPTSIAVNSTYVRKVLAAVTWYVIGFLGFTIPREPPLADVTGEKENSPHVVLAALPQHRPEVMVSLPRTELGAAQNCGLAKRRAQEKPAWLVKGGFQGTAAEQQGRVAVSMAADGSSSSIKAGQSPLDVLRCATERATSSHSSQVL